MITGIMTIIFLLIVLASTFLTRSLLIPMLILGIGALFMAIASAIKIIRQPKVERILEKKLFAPLVLYLLGIAVPTSLYLSLYAGLGHSARAQALLAWQWLLVFILVKLLLEKGGEGTSREIRGKRMKLQFPRNSMVSC
jgi:hypothetical protein